MTPTRSGSAGSILDLIRTHGPATRAELASVSGLGRSALAARIEQLLADDLITETGEAQSTGGRPPTLLSFNQGAGVVLVADLGATHGRLAICDLGGDPLVTEVIEEDIAIGPEKVLDAVDEMWTDLMARTGHTLAAVRGVGIGVPGPVEFAAGRAVNPPIMPGWDGFGIRDHLTERYGAPSFVDNDVNIMALGERADMDDPPADMVFVKVGTGIGSGLVLGGRIHRGATGTAGDIGHIEVGPDSVVCRCGNRGCLEASAGGAALAGQLAALGVDAGQSRDVAALARSGHPEATRLVRDAGRMIGEALAAIVNLVNPSLIVIGGDIGTAGGSIVAGIREIVYRRSTALATNDLEIRGSKLGDHAGVRGAAAMVLDHVLAPGAVDAALAGAG